MKNTEESKLTTFQFAPPKIIIIIILFKLGLQPEKDKGRAQPESSGIHPKTK